MRLTIGLVRLRVWPSLRRVLFAALALVVALGGGASLRQAQAQETLERILVYFSALTPPPKPGVICKDEDYDILVQPLRQLPLPSVAPRRLPLLHSIVFSLTAPALGTMNGQHGPAGLYTSGGVGVFTYRAQQTGQEKLNFGWTDFIRPDFPLNNPSHEDIVDGIRITGDTEFPFEVKECAYKVSLVYKGTFASAGTSGAGIGLRLDTKLVKNENGTFEGSGSFVMEQNRNVPSCVFSLDDFQAPTRITGTILENTGELQLTFDLGKGTYSASGACPGAGGSSSSHTVDVAQLTGVRSVKFPSWGGTKQLETPKIPAWTTRFTIIVEEIETQ
jgi:hypothetical protein